MIGQEASTLANEYGPQCMNMPNLASRYHAVRSSTAPARKPRGRIKGRQEDRTAALMKSRRFGVNSRPMSAPECNLVRSEREKIVLLHFRFFGAVSLFSKEFSR